MAKISEKRLIFASIVNISEQLLAFVLIAKTSRRGAETFFADMYNKKHIDFLKHNLYN